jgi:hypothetical protein
MYLLDGITGININELIMEIIYNILTIAWWLLCVLSVLLVLVFIILIVALPIYLKEEYLIFEKISYKLTSFIFTIVYLLYLSSIFHILYLNRDTLKKYSTIYEDAMNDVLDELKTRTTFWKMSE